MKINIRIFYSIIAFIALFCYLYPISFNFFPIDTGEILHLCGGVYFILRGGRYLNKDIYEMLKIAILVMIIGIFATAVYNHVYDLSLVKKILSFFLYPFSAMLVVHLISKSTKSFSAYLVFEWIIYITVIQGVISMAMYYDKNLQEYIISYISVGEENENFMEVQSAFRLIALCKFQYANMAVVYGYTLFIAISLAFSKSSKLYSCKLMYFFIILFICIVGVLSARTFFLILFFSFLYYSFLLYKRKGSYSIVHILFILSIVLILLSISMYFLANSEYSQTYRWAFEWYINMDESQSFETGSSNKLQEMYKFPDNLKTWLLGDGVFTTSDGLFYMYTDVGYLRNLFYWGVIGSFMFYYFQYKCCSIICNLTKDWNIKYLCWFLFLWLLVYNTKEFWHANIYWALLLAILIKVKYISRNDFSMYGYL
uniref:hypothetical protein n=1 Tax=uncultured Bacteroides sp. TaxID=162156 RepID=UPI00280C096A|nr:hypothetical protein [uncultured Bacteroides sp.]